MAAPWRQSVVTAAVSCKTAVTKETMKEQVTSERSAMVHSWPMEEAVWPIQQVRLSNSVTRRMRKEHPYITMTPNCFLP